MPVKVAGKWNLAAKPSAEDGRRAVLDEFFGGTHKSRFEPFTINPVGKPTCYEDEKDEAGGQ